MSIRICGDNTTASPAITSASDTDTGLQFGTNEVKVVNGNLDITDGNLKVASGHGIDFSATGDATTTGAASTSELLDDYEEGTWTATVSFNGGTTGITYDSNRDEGHYVKIGKLVFAYFRVHLTSKGSSTGTVRLQGLPYTCADQFSSTGHDGQLYLARGSKFDSSTDPDLGGVGDKPVGGYVSAGTTYGIFAKRNTNGNTANLTNADITDAWDITGSFQYFAT